MREVYVIGVGITKMGRHFERSITSLTDEALKAALSDAGVSREAIQSIWFGNFGWGFLFGQHSIRGQVALRPLGISHIPIVNVENACATGSTAFHGAWKDIASGQCELSVAIGTEKLYHVNKEKSFQVIMTGVDVERAHEMIHAFENVGKELVPAEHLSENGPAGGTEKSSFMDVYSGWTRHHMIKYGTTARQLAIISSKNHYHGSLNPYAQYQKKMSVEEVLADKMISWPLTRSMCAPIGDGSAVAVLCSKGYLKKVPGAKPVKVLASVLGSGSDRALDDDTNDISCHVSRRAYESAGVGPSDLDVVEVHDASAFGEIMATEGIGLCKPGEGGALAESGATTLGGRVPVNLSGGLESRGHPIGATGLGQIHELITQLRGGAGDRGVEGARIGLAENGGGAINAESAAMCVHIFQRA